VIQHLHDILARIILILLEYDGKYQPTVLDVATEQPVDWVKPNTLPGALGYAKGQIKYNLMQLSVKLPDESKTDGTNPKNS
jgi:hypothetical protein